ncbi:MAG: InlB B-repeat-containing protein [Wujia sp.]
MKRTKNLVVKMMVVLFAVAGMLLPCTGAKTKAVAEAAERTEVDVDKLPDLALYEAGVSTAKVWKITDCDGIYNLVNISGMGYTVYIANDISTVDATLVSEVELTDVTIYGENHTIKGENITSTTYAIGTAVLAYSMKNCKVYDLTVDGTLNGSVDLRTKGMFAAVADNSLFENCHSYGFIGNGWSCYYADTQMTSYSFCAHSGGIVGTATNNCVFIRCSNHASITYVSGSTMSNYTIFDYGQIGGIAGYASDCFFYGCRMSEGTFSSTSGTMTTIEPGLESRTGGIVGYAKNCKIKGCYCASDVAGSNPDPITNTVTNAANNVILDNYYLSITGCNDSGITSNDKTNIGKVAPITSDMITDDLAKLKTVAWLMNTSLDDKNQGWWTVDNSENGWITFSENHDAVYSVSYLYMGELLDETEFYNAGETVKVELSDGEAYGVRLTGICVNETDKYPAENGVAQFVMPEQETQVTLLTEYLPYTITYKVDGGTNAIDNPDTYTIVDTVTLKAPVKQDYVFDGWYLDSEYQDKITEISEGSTGNLILYAKWTKVSMDDVSAQPIADITYTGQALTPAVILYYGDNTLLNGTDYEILGYDANVDAGEATIQIQGLGAYEGTKTVSFQILPKARTIEGTDSWSTYLSDRTLLLDVTTQGDGEIVYASQDETIATVSESGLVTMHAVGTVDILVSIPATKNYGSANKTVTLKIAKCNPETCIHVNTHMENQKAASCTQNGYTGDEYCDDCNTLIAQGNLIRKNGHTLVKTDAKATSCTSAGNKVYWTCQTCGLVFGDENAINQITLEEVAIAKKAHIYEEYVQVASFDEDGQIVSKCNVCGAVGKTTVISGIRDIRLAKETYVYDAKTIKPAVTVVDRTGKVVDVSNYTVRYDAGCKNVGKYKVRITFTGNLYSGTDTLTYVIKPSQSKITGLTASKKAIKVKWAKKTSQVSGYEIQYSTSSNFKSGNKTIVVKNNKTTLKEIKNLKAKKKYYVRIRTYKTVKINGKSQKIYSDWSSKKSCKTK